ncbi:GGDEF domain-containing protein [Dielma fastidiosa]|nr:GGDEF domain-containing protein [Dielma fastidiosa]
MLFIFVRKHIYNQKTIVEHLVTSIQKLEKKLYHDDVPESVDFEALLNMSSKGLHDGLTGVMTRSIFLAHAEKLLGNEQKLLVLCFVDLDNLKILNDTHGHQAGDIALRQIGSILRAYETKYEGAVGRYGGDEFILILRDIEDIEELKSILAELVKKLNFNISYSDQEIKISCSIGADIWNQRDSLETLIANADKALYEIKRHGKGTYSLFNNGEEVYEES